MNPARESIATEQFGPYEVYERLGMGGMASVHRAKKRGPAGFERTVALKRMLSHLTEDRGFVESFVREAKVASLLQHPNIAQTYDFGRINGIFYIAMELVSGYDVRKLLRHAHRTNEPIPLPVVVSILGELCEALDYAHSFVDENGQPMHIVHRDISPSNMLLAHTGHLKVIDFGIAKANSRQLHTESGLVKGKLGYMAPEAALGMQIGPVSDLFSMGVVAWELVTCMPLFSARTDFETMRKLREEPVVPPSQHNPSCPPMLDHLILAALEREPERRLQSARAFRATLDQIAAQFGIQTSARAVQEWARQLVPPAEPVAGEPSRPRSTSGLQLPLPPGPPTVMQRPASRAQLRRSTEEIKLAAEIWGEDATNASEADLGDFSMAAGYDEGGAASGHSLPQSAAPPVYPTHGSAPAFAAHPSQPRPLPLPLPPLAVTPLGLSVPSLAPSGGHVVPARLSTVAPVASHAASQVMQAPPRSKTPLLVLTGLAIVAGVLGGVLYAKRAGDEPVAAPASAPSATIRFSTQPDGATIEVGGQPLAGVSPLETTLAPGMYSIAIKRDGYRTMTTTVTLRDGDTMPITVALEPETVAAIVTPPATTAPQADDTPAPDTATSTPPGPDDDDRGGRGDNGTSSTGTRKTRDVKKPDKGGATGATSDPEPDRRPDARPDPVPPDPKPDPKPDRHDPRPDPVTVTPKPEPKPEPAVETKPVRVPTVSPAAVTKLAGDVPTLRSTSGESGDVTAKLCIDDQGRVTSVKVIKAPADIAADLQRALMSWRYKPYVNRDAKVSPACFPVAMRVILR